MMRLVCALLVCAGCADAERGQCVRRVRECVMHGGAYDDCVDGTTQLDPWCKEYLRHE